MSCKIKVGIGQFIDGCIFDAVVGYYNGEFNITASLWNESWVGVFGDGNVGQNIGQCHGYFVGDGRGVESFIICACGCDGIGPTHWVITQMNIGEVTGEGITRIENDG